VIRETSSVALPPRRGYDMNTYQVTHVSKDSSGDITAIGVKDRWQLPIGTAVQRLDARTEGYYVQCPQRADVYVARSPYGKKFLKTTADTTTKNNLDSLPRL
jgi:hypothetical protein